MAPPKSGGLRLRLISTAVILPLAILVVWLGAWWLSALLAVMAVVMCWEWANLCSPGKWDVAVVMMAAGGAVPLVLVAYGVAGACWVIVAGLVVLAVLAVAGRMRSAAICLPGMPYIALGIGCIAWLRADPEVGFLTVFWAAASVVAMDAGGYFVGRRVGGPKLAPRISPNKTWSGLIGGMVCAAAMGIAVSLVLGGAWLAMALCGVLLALISQGGDLIESALKRHFDAKDASQLIPGHGGFLDRFDGYLTAMPAAALMSAIAGGSPVTWQ